MQLDVLGDWKRTHRCGDLRASDAGKTITLMGWVNRRRDHGNLIFVDLRDRSGITQIVFDKERDPGMHARVEAVRNEYVLAVTGKVNPRSDATINPKMDTGEIEVVADELRLLNESKLPPFAPGDANLSVNEEVRLKYRYLDLRRPEMHHNVEMRHRVTLAIRNYLSGLGFYEIETPILTRSTPEGARDYLVPSRVHPGEFYALPQSPQIFKQLLMIGGMDRYFQIARCFRDEDLRADRQPEFTQIDLELAFPTEDVIHKVVEGFLDAAFKAAGHTIERPFPEMPYDEAIRQYGIDKPDLRLPAMTDVKAAFPTDALATLQVEQDLPFVVIRTPKVGDLSRKERDEHKLLVSEKQAKVIKFFDDFKRLEKSWPQAIAKVRELCGAEEGDLLILVGAPKKEAAESGNDAAAARRLHRESFSVYSQAGLLRLALAQKYAERHKAFEQQAFKFLWVTDFPSFEWDENSSKWTFAHHPFTSIHEDHQELLAEGVKAQRDPNSALGSIRARAYDVVLNGTELGSGWIRIHQQEVQAKIFEALGMDAEEQKLRFGFFLEALQYGTPPHGGIALGLDRIVMILAGAANLREVIPFP
ncbi:MAG: aspartate--tRNA ligase, partial [Acidobacteriota bacterium]|nr:aspartate--tRNA ligase [Acidobacteriota bacterium]